MSVAARTLRFGAALALVAAAWLLAALPARAADPLFPLGSRLGLAPPPGIALSPTFPGFEDQLNHVYIRIVAMPDKAFAEIERTMTNDALKKQGMTVEKREPFPLASGSRGLLIVAQQEADAVRLRKWLLVAPVGDLTALISIEIPNEATDRYPEAAIRTALATTTARPSIPVEEQLQLVPFRFGDLGGMRVWRVLPGTAVQLTDGPKEEFDATTQSYLVISIGSGTPDPRDRENFARLALSGLPPLKDLRVTGSEPLRLGRQQGYEIRAEAKDPKTGVDIQIVQWLRFGTGAYVRLIGIGPKEGWSSAFMRFRTVRDAMEVR